MRLPSRAVDLTSRDGTRLTGMLDRCSPSRATVVLCHGVAEHSGRYARLVEHLIAADVSTLRIDLRGHGASSGQRGHVDRFTDYLDDLDAALAQLAKDPAREPWFLFGHSMGAVVVTQHLLGRVSPRPIHGVILSSPGFVPAVPIPRYRQLLGACLLPFAPRLPFELGITAHQLTADPNAQRARDTDPLVFSKVSVRWYHEYRSAAEQCLARAAELRLPLYVCVGAADNVVAPSGARQFVDTASSCDKTLRVWDGLLHEPLNEHVGDAVTAEMVAWLDRQLSRETRG